MWKQCGFRSLGVVLSVAVLAGAGYAQSTVDEDRGINFALTANEKAQPKDVGLAVYPNAREHKEDDSSKANLAFSGTNFGFKLVVLKYESVDAPAKVAMFYRKELAKYGKVLDCSDPKNAKSESSDNGLSCKDEHPDDGSIVLKAGTKERQHLVGIKPEGGQSVFSLIYLESRDSKHHFD